MKIKVKVNGLDHNVSCDPEKPLLWVLREDLKFKGTKYGCGKGLCGACTVHVNGEATRSCQLTVKFAQGKDITTIEGLSKTDSHPLQLAWIEKDVPQCGYCQAGQMMQAASLLKKNPHPSSGEIDAAMNGNICRCGTYLRIREAILTASAPGRSEAELQSKELNSQEGAV